MVGVNQMSWNQSVLRLTVVAVFTLAFAAIGWCGAPFGLPTAMGNSCGMDKPCSDESRFLSVSAGRGQAMFKAVPVETGVSLRDLSLGPGYTNAAQMKLHQAEVGGLRFNFTWDHYYSFCSGSAYYSGPPHPILAPAIPLTPSSRPSSTC